jgi:hypothetical protein
MKRRLKERLKDIIIDQIYHYCYNEVVLKIESDTLNVTLEAGNKLKDNPYIKELISKFIGSSDKAKMHYDTRNDTYCNLIEGREPLKSFMDRLIVQGYKRSENLHNNIENAIQFLVYRSYLKRNYPKTTELALTQKGINHYTTGRSFEDLYINGRNTGIALIISIISIVIAFCAFAISFRQ